ncbi:MAG: RsmB/NOP family class I SAM-dependent RNA methyltransferase [Bdellovibrionaceae bacterium]|nr:RsmB/NOP family class I SAM-dependent RNA methyltransferase [Pseudobdellovibrionaceae bacterium]
MNEFERYFSELYSDKWNELYQSLQAEERQICFSAFETQSPSESFTISQTATTAASAPKDSHTASINPSFLSLLQILKNLDHYAFTDHQQASLRHADGHIQNYILDPASLAPVMALNIEPSDQVLDLCAAPGGKSLGILSQLGQEGSMICNDSSESRSHRLRKVLKQYTPKDHLATYKVLNKDGTKFGFYFPQSFSKILVDVPCSSERHHIHQNNTEGWNLKTSKRLAQKQYTLLCAALLCAQADAHIVYSTCSINPIENDDVIAKFLKKKKDHVELIPAPSFDELGSCPTTYGQMILPHIKGYGPIFYCKLKVTSPL